jgi:probable F420-dependent oxidoreductase
MQFGVSQFPTDESMRPDGLARLIQDHGLESLFFSEHTHIPAARNPPRRGDSALARRYLHTYDLSVAMTMAVSATDRLRVGSGVCLVVQHDPIVLAKQVASMDHLSGGRVIFGVGAGWNREEMRNHGTDPRTRMTLLGERMLAMREIWTHDIASFHGTFVNFDAIWSWPKPAQRPYPPILVGGTGPTVGDRVLQFADGWFPNHDSDLSAIPRWQAMAADADRPVGLSVGSTPADARVIERYASAGAERVVHTIPSAPRGPLERALARWEQSIADFLGE